MVQQKELKKAESYERDHFLEQFSLRFQQAIQESGHDVTADQENLAKQFGVSRQAVRKWIEGKTLPSPSRLPEIADAMGVRHGWLATGELPIRELKTSIVRESPPPYGPNTSCQDEFPINREEAVLLKQFRKLPSEARELFGQLFTVLGG